MRIYMPTTKSPDDNKTLAILPAFLQSNLELVRCITTSALDAYQHIKEIAEKRGEPYWIMDDDFVSLHRRHYRPRAKKPWSFVTATEDDWKDLVSQASVLTENGFELVTLATAGHIPDKSRWPHKEGLIGFSWFCFSGKKLDAKWNVIPPPFGDIDFGMQIIDKGYKVARLETFCFRPSLGCTDHRTILESQRLVCERWPQFVKKKERKLRRNDRAPTEPQVTKYFVKAYKQRTNK